MTVRTRFAPSPTGYLHIGGARTALFSWLFARQHGGQFVLRVEDTDQERSTTAAMDAILQGMAWLGLDHDEGPLYQTQRFDRYQAVIQQLLASGHAYRCYCTKERLEALRAEKMANKEKPRYDGHCRPNEGDSAAAPHSGKPFVIRFKNPLSGHVSFIDQVSGTVTFRNDELDDLIIARSDGTPTYNLTVVVDDWDMGITHVIRGDDHLNNTPRQINLLRALGAALPQYAHIPMILGADGKRLSKRHGATSVLAYREQGYLPEAMLNYLVRLGWSHGDQEIFTIAQMQELFSLPTVNKAAAAINPDKLDWINQHYLKTLPTEQVATAWRELMPRDLDLSNGPALEKVVLAQRERAKTLAEMTNKSRFFYTAEIQYEDKAQKHLKAEILMALQEFTQALAALSSWSAENIHQTLTALAEQHGLKLGKLAQPIRVAVTGGTVSPPIDATLYLIGQSRSVARLQAACQWISAAATQS